MNLTPAEMFEFCFYFYTVFELTLSIIVQKCYSGRDFQFFIFFHDGSFQLFSVCEEPDIAMNFDTNLPDMS